jgi:hypothetical protein
MNQDPTVTAGRLIAECLAATDNEQLAVLQLRILLLTGEMAKVFGVPVIESSRFEYRIPGVGFADLALFHPGGGLTLVEAKGPESPRTLVGGIGQLFMYEAGARRLLTKAGRPPPFVRRVLCAPVLAEHAFPVWAACQIAGVHFVHLQTRQNLQQAAAEDLAALEA